MIYCDWQPAIDAKNKRDAYLRRVATTLAEAPGISTEGTYVHPLREILGD